MHVNRRVLLQDKKSSCESKFGKALACSSTNRSASACTVKPRRLRQKGISICIFPIEGPLRPVLRLAGHLEATT